MPNPEIYLRVCREPELECSREAEDPGGASEEEEEEEEEEPSSTSSSLPIEIQVTATSYVGELKDRLNARLGKQLGLPEEEILNLPRMCLMTGRKVWSDGDTIRRLVESTGGLSELKYGAVRIAVCSVDLRDPPPRSPDEEAELERLRILHEIKMRERARTKRQRPTKLRRKQT